MAVPVYALLDALPGGAAGPADTRLGAWTTLHRWLVLLASSAVVSGTAAAIAIGIGLVGGILLARSDLHARTAFAVVVVFAACVPVYVAVVFFLSCFPAVRLSGSAVACGVLYGLIYSPLAVLVLGAALRLADTTLEDLARLDAGPLTVLARVTLPQASWGVAMLGMLVILLVGTDITITDTLAVRTFAEEVYTQYLLDRSRRGPALTALPLLVLLGALLVGVQARYRLVGEHSATGLSRPPRCLRLGRWRGVVTAGAAGAALLVFGWPLAELLRHIGSLSGFASAAGPLTRELCNSALLAAAGGAAVVLPAVGLAWGLIRGGRLRFVIAAGVVVLLATPAPVVGIGLIGLLNRPGVAGSIYDSPLSVVIGYVVRFLPLGVLLLAAAVRRIPVTLEAAARLDGCDWLGIQRHIYWPNLGTDLAMVWLVIVILCLGEIGATILVVPPGWDTVAVRAFTLLHFGVYRDLAVLAVLSAGTILVLALPLVWLLRRRVRQAGALPGQTGR